MRTDVRIDRKQVKCKNSEVIGYSKWIARCGYIIHFKEGPHTRFGRVIGRIAHGYEGDESLENHLVVITIGYDLGHSFERWVDPDDVIAAYDPKDVSARILETMQYVLSPEILRADIDEVRRCAEAGYATLEKYQARHAYAKA